MIAAIITNSTGYFQAAQTTDNNYYFSISADAANNSIKKPQISIRNAFADKIEVTVKNLSQYKTSTVFNVYINNIAVMKNVKYSSIKSNSNFISIYKSDKINLKANTSYNIKVTATYNKNNSGYSTTVKAKTATAAYYCVKSGAPIYTLKNSKMVKSSKVSELINVKGAFSTNKGAAVAGKDSNNYKGEYVKILEGTYKGKYVKFSDGKVNRIGEDEYKRRVVSSYAASMNGGRYIYGGASYKATDCSGLTMLSYKQIGVNLPHSSSGQAKAGKAVSKNSMKAGDILILNGGGHVAMYIGNNKIVHAMNSYDGIKVQNVSNLKYYTVNSVRRII
ncbi:MAG: C40 family peptidase [Ruminococcus sp.]|nr:C40 family peptidase [Ruminococcus sp.]